MHRLIKRYKRDIKALEQHQSTTQKHRNKTLERKQINKINEEPYAIAAHANGQITIYAKETRKLRCKTSIDKNEYFVIITIGSKPNNLTTLTFVNPVQFQLWITRLLHTALETKTPHQELRLIYDLCTSYKIRKEVSTIAQNMIKSNQAKHKE